MVKNRIIELLVVAGIEFILSIGWQDYKADDALIPLSLIRQRSFSAAFCLSATLLVHSYYLLYRVSAVRDRSTVFFGVTSIPYSASNFVCSMIADALVTRTGYFNPPALLGPVIGAVGCGLSTTLNAHTTTARWVDHKILAKDEMGIAIQQGLVAVQAVVSRERIPIATVSIFFAQSNLRYGRKQHAPKQT